MKSYTFTKDQEKNEKVIEQIKKDCETFIHFAKCNGYDVYYPFVEESGFKLQLIKNDSVDYMPKIYIKNINKLLNQDEVGVEIQTTSYGSLSYKEFEKFLAAQHNAMKVAAEIEKLYKDGYFPTVIYDSDND